MGVLGTLARSLVPESGRKSARAALRGVKARLYQGHNVFCPFCDQGYRAFLTYGDPPRPGVLCPRCGSVERQRYLWWCMKRLGLPKPGSKIVHFAPEKCLEAAFKGLPQVSYVSADVLPHRAMIQADLQDIQLPSNSVDLLICSHVLEHVDDDRQAMRELARVLTPEGRALLQIPLDIGRQDTYEDFTIVTPEGRREAFGQDDHVRIYGMDVTQRLESAGFRVESYESVKECSPEVLREWAIAADEVLYVCAKK